jgi:hypothetical protein
VVCSDASQTNTPDQARRDTCQQPESPVDIEAFTADPTLSNRSRALHGHSFRCAALLCTMPAVALQDRCSTIQWEPLAGTRWAGRSDHTKPLSRQWITTEDAAAALAAAGIDISGEPYDLEDVRDGMNVELEHGTRFPDLDVSGDDPVATAKIALAHLREFPDYYERLAKMEREAESGRSVQKSH